MFSFIKHLIALLTKTEIKIINKCLSNLSLKVISCIGTSLCKPDYMYRYVIQIFAFLSFLGRFSLSIALSGLVVIFFTILSNTL